MKDLLIRFICLLLAFLNLFHDCTVIKVQIVLPHLLSIHMAREWEIFFKTLMFEVIVPLCLGVLLRCCPSSFISLICSGFQENYHTSCWRQFVWHDSTTCARALLPDAACVLDRNQSTMGEQWGDFLKGHFYFILFICNCLLDEDLCRWSHILCKI